MRWRSADVGGFASVSPSFQEYRLFRVLNGVPAEKNIKVWLEQAITFYYYYFLPKMVGVGKKEVRKTKK